MPRGAEKIAISLDPALLEQAEKLRKTTGESRSALIGRALRALLRSEARARRIAEYVASYRRKPESAREVTIARRLAARALSAVEWDES